MTPDEAAKRFNELQKMIQKDLPVFIVERVAHSAVALITERVINTGRNYLGGSFGRYSTRPMLTSGTTAKSSRVGRALASSKSKRRNLNWVTIKRAGKNVHLFELRGGYAQLRRLEGLQASHKSFEFTTQMWRGFGVKRKSKTPTEFVVTLGGKNLESQKKINMNSRREGINIVNLSKKELDQLARMVDKELQRYINKVGLS